MQTAREHRLDRSPALAIALGLAAATIPWIAVHPQSWWVGVVALGLVVAVITWGVSNIRSGVFVRGFHQGPRGRPEIALTFDDGPDAEWTPRVLDILERYGVRATFFVIGRRVEAHPEIVARIVAAGHEVGVHTYDHGLDYAFRSRARLRQDFERSCAALTSAGAPPPRWFRPPNGLLNPRIAMEVTRSGLRVAGWTVRPRDGVRVSSDVVFRRVASALRGGDVVLLHDARSPHGLVEIPPAVDALPRILDLLNARALRAVSLTELSEGAGSA